MKSMQQSFTAKFHHAEEQAAFIRNTRKRIIILVLSTLLLLALIIGAVAIHKRKQGPPPSDQRSSPQSVKAVCSQTRYPESCYSTLSNSNTTDPEQLFKLSLQVASDSLSALSSLPEALMNNTNNHNDKEALKVCGAVINDALDILRDSISSMDVKKSGDYVLSQQKINDLTTWLSAALTNQETCLDTLQEMDSRFLLQVKSQMQNSAEHTSNCLAVVTKILWIMENLDIPIHRKLLGQMKSGFPLWPGQSW